MDTLLIYYVEHVILLRLSVYCWAYVPAGIPPSSALVYLSLRLGDIIEVT